MAGGLAFAQGPGGPGMGPGFGQHRPPMERAFGGAFSHGQWWNNPNVAKQLNLTDDQRKAMDGILQDHRMTLVDLEANLQKAELGMQPLMKADTPDQAAILSQIDKVAQARAELEKANARFLLALRAKLTPDQWKQLRTMHANRMEHPGTSGQGGGWGHDGGRSGMTGPGNRFYRRQGPPPAGTAPQGAPAAPPAGTPPSGSGDVQ
jgi:periplasmic protein CpxP/Spy